MKEFLKGVSKLTIVPTVIYHNYWHGMKQSDFVQEGAPDFRRNKNGNMPQAVPIILFFRGAMN
jgi:hypothetical protein